jgi:uncharacterized protein YoxC
MPGSLDTTNTMLAIIAAVSVLQGLVLLGVGIAGFKLYRSATATLRELDEKRVQPLAAKVDGILAQVHRITESVQRRAEKVEAAIDDTVGRVDDVKASVNETVHRVSGAVGGIRAAIVNALTSEPRPGRPNGTVPHPAVRDGGSYQTPEHVREGGF